MEYTNIKLANENRPYALNALRPGRAEPQPAQRTIMSLIGSTPTWADAMI